MWKKYHMGWRGEYSTLWHQIAFVFTYNERSDHVLAWMKHSVQWVWYATSRLRIGYVGLYLLFCTHIESNNFCKHAQTNKQTNKKVFCLRVFRSFFRNLLAVIIAVNPVVGSWQTTQWCIAVQRSTLARLASISHPTRPFFLSFSKADKTRKYM